MTITRLWKRFWNLQEIYFEEATIKNEEEIIPFEEWIEVKHPLFTAHICERIENYQISELIDYFDGSWTMTFDSELLNLDNLSVSAREFHKPDKMSICIFEIFMINMIKKYMGFIDNFAGSPIIYFPTWKWTENKLIVMVTRYKSSTELIGKVLMSDDIDW